MAGDRPSQRYQLGERIGGGGMAEVFEAKLFGAEGFLRPVAVKRIQPSLSSDATFGQMFVNEARIASLLHHPNIAAVLDFDRDEDGSFFLVMELIRGLDLRRLMETGRLPLSIAVHIAAEMLRGLHYAHELEQGGLRLGIVHRDISPHNVMVSWDGAVKLVDFGIAKAMAATGISRAGTIKGKVAYMSPEQANALEIDGRTDVFAVGVVLHEILVGERLFRGTTEPEILARLLTQPIPRPMELAPHTPPDLDRVVMKMLERDRDARYPTAHAALEELLATSATSPRAALELEQLLGERFPDEAPRRRAAAELASAPAAVNPSAATMPARPGAAGPSVPASRTTATRPENPARIAPRPVNTLAAAGPGRWAAEVPPARPVRGRRWRAGAIIVLAAAAVTSGVLIARQQQQREPVTAEDATENASTIAETVAREPRRPVGSDGSDGASAVPLPRTVTPPPPTPEPAPVRPADGAGAAADAGPPSVNDRDSGERRRAREPRRSSPGFLAVTVDPWASVTVDGIDRGQTYLRISLSPGPHRVVLRNTELGKTESLTVKIKSRETTSLKRTWQ
jgi:serine/threonine protein kinase